MINVAFGVYRREATPVISRFQQTTRPWGVGWAERTVTWGAHVVRNNHDCCWSANLLEIRSSAELQQRRREHGNRPATRSLPGFTCRRWTDGVAHALDYLSKNNTNNSMCAHVVDAVELLNVSLHKF